MADLQSPVQVRQELAGLLLTFTFAILFVVSLLVSMNLGVDSVPIGYMESVSRKRTYIG